jgi:hypothetical protein
VGRSTGTPCLDRADEEEERLLLVLALGESTGEQGPPFLRRLVRDCVPSEAGLSIIALTPFAERCGSEATPDLLERFSDSRCKANAQRGLLNVLARYADDRAGEAVLGWLKADCAVSSTDVTATLTTFRSPSPT